MAALTEVFGLRLGLSFFEVTGDYARNMLHASIAALGFLVVSVPGLLTERLHLSVEQLASNPAGFLGLHLERLLVFAMFWSLLIFLWRLRPAEHEDTGSVIAIEC